MSARRIGHWRLWRVPVETTRRGDVYAVARDPNTAVEIAADAIEEDWLGEPDVICGEARPVDHDNDFELKQARDAWSGEPLLPEGAPDSLRVDLGPKLAKALALLKAEELQPGTRAYQDLLESQGQMRLDGEED